MLAAFLRPVLQSLLSNRQRTGLTVLGLSIGIAAVICTAALGAGASNRVEEQIDALGEDFLWIQAGRARVGGARMEAGSAPSLTADDARALSTEVPEILECSPVIQGREQLVSGGQNWNTRYQGVLPSYFDVRRRKTMAGNAFAEADVTAAARVLVLGSEVSTRLFGQSNPVGQNVRMGRFLFRVIGVFQPRGIGRGGVDRDDVVFVPMTTAWRNLDRRDRISDIMCGVSDPDVMDHAEAQAASLLRWRHDIYDGQSDDFEIQKPIEALEARAESARTMAMLLVGIGAVSLIVGGVGIMNIMLVTVADRRREIGVRLAMGARVRDIRRHFLLEAATLGLAGAICGVVAGRMASWAITQGLGWRADVSSEIVLTAVGVAVGAGLIFGYYPAHVASRMDPIEAIRAEN
jgi:putative ABC transport system permease protein